MDSSTSRYILLLSLTFLFFTSCDKLEYSPNQKDDNHGPRNINAVNLSRLMQAPGDDTVRFILSGDTQRGYGEAKDFVKRVNTLPNIDFVVIAGDISDFGLLQEMEWVAGIYNGLKVPYLGIIGNHDLTANGKHVFQKVFGELDYSFVYRGNKFICTNTNSREVNFDGSVPDIAWLNRQFTPDAGVKNSIVISHVMPGSVDFDKKLEQQFIGALESSNNCIGSLHAHDHSSGYYTPYDNGIPFIVTGAVLKRNFTVVTIINGELETESVSY